MTIREKLDRISIKIKTERWIIITDGAYLGGFYLGDYKDKEHRKKLNTSNIDEEITQYKEYIKNGEKCIGFWFG